MFREFRVLLFIRWIDKNIVYTNSVNLSSKNMESKISWSNFPLYYNVPTSYLVI